MTLKEYEEKVLKTKALTNVVQRPEVDMGQFEGLTVYERAEAEEGMDSMELPKTAPKRTRSKGADKKGKKEVSLHSWMTELCAYL